MSMKIYFRDLFQMFGPYHLTVENVADIDPHFENALMSASIEEAITLFYEFLKSDSLMYYMEKCWHHPAVSTEDSMASDSSAKAEHMTMLNWFETSPSCYILDAFENDDNVVITYTYSISDDRGYDDAYLSISVHLPRDSESALKNEILKISFFSE